MHRNCTSDDFILHLTDENHLNQLNLYQRSKSTSKPNSQSSNRKGHKAEIQKIKYNYEYQKGKKKELKDDIKHLKQEKKEKQNEIDNSLKWVSLFYTS